jgi:hypothetical protein
MCQLRKSYNTFTENALINRHLQQLIIRDPEPLVGANSRSPLHNYEDV